MLITSTSAGFYKNFWYFNLVWKSTIGVFEPTDQAVENAHRESGM